MQVTTWRQALIEIGVSIADAVVRFFKHDMVQVALSMLMFLGLALPMLIVMLVLWYIDSTGWRPAGGFYKIGDASAWAQPVCVAQWGLLLARSHWHRTAPPPAPPQAPPTRPD